uniref:Uncharacterized protein n=1 Tax=Lepeophtheirus salmonis TaxID=72036 RepID=A0A0K2UB78_LEPSM
MIQSQSSPYLTGLCKMYYYATYGVNIDSISGTKRGIDDYLLWQILKFLPDPGLGVCVVGVSVGVWFHCASHK